jgi:hypothetical protein
MATGAAEDTMPVAEREALSTGGTDLLDAFASFLTALHKLEYVRRAGVARTGGLLEVWVLTRTEIDEDLSTIYRAEYEFRRTAGQIALDVHVVPLSEVDPSVLPEMQTIFER